MIEKGISIPPKTGRLKYPFEQMEVGDSFFIDKSMSVSSTVWYWQKKLPGRKFTIRTIDGGVRVWRVE